MIGRRSTITAIGLDLGAATLRAVQLQRRGGRVAAVDAIELQRLKPGRPFDADEAQRLADVLSRRSFVGGSVVASVPPSDLIHGLLEVGGKAEGGPMLEAALEIERTHSLEPGTYELAAWLPPTSTNRRTTAVCVNGCRHDTARKLLDTFDAAGLSVVALDSRPCAIGRSLNDAAQAGELTAVLDIETDRTELVLLHDGAVVYQRPLIDAGLEQAEKRVAELGLDAPTCRHCLQHIGLGHLEHDHAAPVRKALAGFVQSLVQEADPALDYAARLYPDLPIQRLAVVGRGAAVPALGYELQQQLRMGGAAALLNVSGLTQTNPFAVAVGLALHPEEVSWAAA